MPRSRAAAIGPRPLILDGLAHPEGPGVRRVEPGHGPGHPAPTRPPRALPLGQDKSFLAYEPTARSEPHPEEEPRTIGMGPVSLNKAWELHARAVPPSATQAPRVPDLPRWTTPRPGS